MDIISTYNNGNTSVTIYADGTKVREYEEHPHILHPESIDIKITNYCDLGCSYCHESSTKAGIHGDLSVLLNVIRELPSGVELAIGGGNPLSHPDLLFFLIELKSRGIIANLTVNQGHLKMYDTLLKCLIAEDLVKGIGISITSNNFTYIEQLNKLTNNIVFHLIAGVNDISLMDRLITYDNAKVLILGYKMFGFGISYKNASVDQSIIKWKKYLPKYVHKCVLSFDNLAIKQLNVKRLFTHDGWDKFYMGDDFCFTMYIDAVKQEYAPTSRDNNRTSFNDKTLFEYFSNNGLNKMV
jgi:hypothetical protein